MTKFLIIGDLHGNKPIISTKDFDAIIAPGDFCSDKGIRPLIKEWVKARKSGKSTDDDTTFMKKRVGARGLRKLEENSIKEGRKILEFLDKFHKPVYIVPGNWDQSYGKSKIKDINKNNYYYRKTFLDYYLNSTQTNKKLTKGLKNIKDCQYKLFEEQDFNIIGYGLSSAPELPRLNNKDYNLFQKLTLKREYNKIKKKIDKVYKSRDKGKPTIFLTHNVPYKTKLDRLVDKRSPLNNKNFGSMVAREFCEKNQPIVCIGGHMHEHFGKGKIGKTICINAGFGSKVNTILEIKDNKIKKLKFIKS